MENKKTKRLGSIDVLRGFDLFCLVFFKPVFVALAKAINLPITNWLTIQFAHESWEGFVFWDIIMPLFLFLAGASMPFAFAKHLNSGSKAQLCKRIIKRVILLWIFGMICQGNLLGLDASHIYFYSNTLQSIAIGYLISAILLMNFKIKGQIIITSGMLLVYWVILSFVKIDGNGGGDFTPDHNLAEYIDRVVLGRFRDGSMVTPLGIDFGNYRYTWIISSLNFGVTVMTGVFAGHILKSTFSEIKKMKWLTTGGVLMIIAGLLLSLQMPIIKKIWDTSMTLYSSGICFLLMAFFYYIIEYKKYGKYLNWLKIYGMNSIMAYVLYEVFDFSCIGNSIFFGMEQFIGVDYYLTLIVLTKVSIIFFILWLMYKNGKFLKV